MYVKVNLGYNNTTCMSKNSTCMLKLIYA